MVLKVRNSSLDLWSLNLESELSAKLSILSILEITPALLCHILEQAHHELVLVEFHRLLEINFMHVGALAKINAVDLLALYPILAVQQDHFVFLRVFLRDGSHSFLFDLNLEAFGLVVVTEHDVNETFLERLEAHPKQVKDDRDEELLVKVEVVGHAVFLDQLE